MLLPGWTRLLGLLIGCGSLALLLSGCNRVSGSGRNQFNVLSVDEEVSLGDQAYDEMLAPPEGEAPHKITDGPQWEQVKRVSDKIFAAANRRHPEIATRFNWEIVLIDDRETVNAWALPGGKCAVYTGLLRVANSDDMLAAVLGHEASHAIARHGGERISQGLVLDLISNGMILAELPPVAQEGTMMALGIGGLKFSRDQESEADAIGLLISADAGYEPPAAITLWERMGAESQGAPPEFLSTHPSYQTRIERLRALQPRAEAIYRARLAAPNPNEVVTPAK